MSEKSDVPAASVTAINPRLLEFLVCPVTRGTLEYDSGRQELISRGANLAYPIHNGVPVMLTGEARVLDD